MSSKRELLAQAGAYSGFTRLAEAIPGPPLLLILNYHRIGDAAKTPYDSGTFSCTVDELDWQVSYLKRRFPIVTLEQAADIVHGRSAPLKTSVLITFDDGYRDNYDAAFPVFVKHQVSASFFLPTSYIGTGYLPWWDLIAYIVKTSCESRIALAYPESAEFDLTPARRARSVMEILKLFKRPSMTDAERFISELEAACGSTRPAESAERCFLNWDEAREMQRGGMCFGSHTHTHEILGKLSLARQTEELQTSREILERELDRTIDTLAYPVGKLDTFSADTFTALRNARYETAFSFYSGVNHPGHIQPFDVLRCSVDQVSRPLFRLRMALRTATGRNIF
ncbi:MAG TPA: polysaccharide deacetylase family protein [Acidobacteriaceae bacterium]|nr:polysaccharide deacetylase family protein [Acidobacteriaceae bacterium]